MTIKFFGKDDCWACNEIKCKFDAAKIPYTFIDLNTPEGLAECAEKELFNAKYPLPIVLVDEMYIILDYAKFIYDQNVQS